MLQLGKAILIISIFCMLPMLLQAQDRADLERQQKELQNKIAYTNELLTKISDRQKQSISSLQLVKDQIQARSELINNYTKELLEIKNDQVSTEAQIVEIKKQMAHLSNSYQEMLRDSYRAKLLDNKWLFLLSAASFNQLFKRWQYLRQINKFWRAKLEAMTNQQQQLEKRQKELTDLVVEKDALIAESIGEQKKLESDRRKYDQIARDLASEEHQLRADLKDQQQAREKLRNAIANIIAKVSSDASSADLPSTPAMTKLARSFESNRGKLPWPVRKGIIVRSFGQQKHPTLRNVTVNNNGVDIKTESGAPIHAIFDGTVVGHQYIPGYDHMLILAHGSFYTVYSYLKEIDVSKGTTIHSDQILGVAREQDGIGEVHLEIWHGKELLDPKDWLMTQ